MEKNPPDASHMGSVWERQIRSVRSILSALMLEHDHALDGDSLRTLLAEVECIINSCPLTVPSSDPGDLDPLPPSHPLTMKSKIVMPPRVTSRKPMFTSNEDGNEFNICPSFGQERERSTSRPYKR